MLFLRGSYPGPRVRNPRRPAPAGRIPRADLPRQRPRLRQDAAGKEPADRDLAPRMGIRVSPIVTTVRVIRSHSQPKATSANRRR
jgi:hypothetical protein